MGGELEVERQEGSSSLHQADNRFETAGSLLKTKQCPSSFELEVALEKESSGGKG